MDGFYGYVTITSSILPHILSESMQENTIITTWTLVTAINVWDESEAETPTSLTPGTSRGSCRCTYGAKTFYKEWNVILQIRLKHSWICFLWHSCDNKYVSKQQNPFRWYRILNHFENHVTYITGVTYNHVYSRNRFCKNILDMKWRYDICNISHTNTVLCHTTPK